MDNYISYNKRETGVGLGGFGRNIVTFGPITFHLNNRPWASIFSIFSTVNRAMLHTIMRLENPGFRQALRQAHIYGAGFGFSQSMIFFMYAAAYRFGAYLIEQGEMEPLNVFR